MLPFGLVALRGQWQVLRRNAGLITLYGVLAVAGAQFCYFSAVAHMQVGPALLIEYTAPAAVVCWQWLRHGQRPGRLTLSAPGSPRSGWCWCSTSSLGPTSTWSAWPGRWPRWSVRRRTS